MRGEANPTVLLRAMQPRLLPGAYQFVTLALDHPALPALRPLMTIREEEGLTVVAETGDVAAAGLTGSFPCRQITLTIHSSLGAVGLLAAVTAGLAKAGISVNAVSGYFHDHLFVPADRADEALTVLEDLSRKANLQD